MWWARLADLSDNVYGVVVVGMSAKGKQIACDGGAAKPRLERPSVHNSLDALAGTLAFNSVGCKSYHLNKLTQEKAHEETLNGSPQAFCYDHTW